VISHDVDLLETVVNKVWYLDANRSQIDIYNMGWKRYLEAQREADEKRRKRERANAEKKAGALQLAGRQDARQGHQDRRRAEHGPPRREAAVRPGRGAAVRQGRQAALPGPRAVRQDPADREGLSKSYGSLEIFTDVDLAVDRAPGSSSSASTARARPPCCGCWPGSRSRTPARCRPVTG
jgi:ATPase subunit of ABC transporter with duplicated ATPase domains